MCSKSVNLCVFCQKYPNKELHADGKESLWDARRGFTVPSHLISYAGVVSCQTHIGNETFKSPLYIVAVVGKSYLFFCFFEQSEYYALEWLHLNVGFYLRVYVKASEGGKTWSEGDSL